MSKLIKEKQIDRETIFLSQEYIRRKEMAVTNHVKFRALVIWTLIKRWILYLIHFFQPNKQELQKQHLNRQKKLVQVSIGYGRSRYSNTKKWFDANQ